MGIELHSKKLPRYELDSPPNIKRQETEEKSPGCGVRSVGCGVWGAECGVYLAGGLSLDAQSRQQTQVRGHHTRELQEQLEGEGGRGWGRWRGGHRGVRGCERIWAGERDRRV